MSEIFFFLFAAAAIIAGILVISSNNPIHSVFSLVLAFANASILLLLLGIDFLALLFLIVYVGAIAILFLFVVMMLNIKLVELLDNATRYLPIGIIIGILFLFEIYFLFHNSFHSAKGELSNYISPEVFYNIRVPTNIQAIGEFLYTDFFIYFILASFILLVAMLAAIVLTLTHEEQVKRQDLFTQIATDYKQTIILKK